MRVVIVSKCGVYYENWVVFVDYVAQNILATANTLVPVRTGYLKSTIAIEQPSNFQLRVKATAPYAYYVEFGTKRMSARLFLTNSVNQHLSEFAPAIEQQIKDLLQG